MFVGGRGVLFASAMSARRVVEVRNFIVRVCDWECEVPLKIICKMISTECSK